MPSLCRLRVVLRVRDHDWPDLPLRKELCSRSHGIPINVTIAVLRRCPSPSDLVADKSRPVAWIPDRSAGRSGGQRLEGGAMLTVWMALDEGLPVGGFHDWGAAVDRSAAEHSADHQR